MDNNDTELGHVLLVRVLEQQTHIQKDVASIAAKLEGLASMKAEVAILQRKVTMGQGALAFLALLGTVIGSLLSIRKLVE